MRRLLIGGGRDDPNLEWLRQAAASVGVDCESVLVAPEAPPAFAWTVGETHFLLDGRRSACDAAFLRYDVFSGVVANSASGTANAAAWHATLSAYCEAVGAKMFNSAIDMVTASKPAMLVKAAVHGLAIPPTLISNARPAIEALGAPEGHIAKPVAGGSYVMTLSEALVGIRWVNDCSAGPAMVQPMLSYPERRIYRVGEEFFAFDIGARTTDSRLDAEGTIAPVDLKSLPVGIVDKLHSLTEELRCDFCAVDMKTDPVSGELVFLELNNGPMFMGYDRTCGGEMARSMVRYLAA